jgi:hypothetical protein
MTWAWEQELPGPQKLLLLALADHAGEDGKCYPGQMRLAEKCGVTDRSIRATIGKLEDTGLVARERRTRDNGSRTSDLYELALPEESSGPNRKLTSGPNRKPTSAPEPSVVEPSDKHPVAEERMMLVFRHWKERMSKNGQAKFTPERKAKVRARLKSYPVADLLRAIDGCAASNFHMKRGRYANRDGPRYNELERILASDTKLEEFRDRAPDYGHERPEDWREKALEEQGL